jgi:hypothetical protein
MLLRDGMKSGIIKRAQGRLMSAQPQLELLTNSSCYTLRNSRLKTDMDIV